jgi:hypothetical protein
MFNEKQTKTENLKLLEILTASLSKTSTPAARNGFNGNEYDNLIGPLEYEYEDAFNSGRFASNFSLTGNASDIENAKFDNSLLSNSIVHFATIILIYGFAMFFLTIAAVYAHRRKIGYNYDEMANEEDQRKKQLFRKLIKKIENCNHYEHLFKQSGDECLDSLRESDGESNLKVQMRMISTFFKILKKRKQPKGPNRTRYNRLVCKNEQCFNESNALLDENFNKTCPNSEFSYCSDESEIKRDNQCSINEINRMEPLLCGRGFVENNV